jgi:electron transfer flavoprotein-quinone oxidoreductase
VDKHAGWDAVAVGPAGSAAAVEFARAGSSVLLREHRPFAGSKTVYGAVIYARILLNDVITQWWEQVQRWVIRHPTMIMTGHQAVTVDFHSRNWMQAPCNATTIYRADFDAWLADHAVTAGATLVPSTVATGLLRDRAANVVRSEPTLLCPRDTGDAATAVLHWPAERWYLNDDTGAGR